MPATMTPLESAQSPPMAVEPSDGLLGETRILIRELTWDLYDRLSDAIGDSQNVRLAFDGRDLEIMSPGLFHEDYKDLLGRLVNAVTTELEIPCKGGAQTTWKRPEIKRGLEADQCYFFGAEKLASIAKAKARKSKDIADLPNPDLAIEIDTSPPKLDRTGIYAALQIAEVWIFRCESLSIQQLQPGGIYAEAESSQFLPITAAEIVRWVSKEDSTDNSAWERRLRPWIRDDLAHRAQRPENV